jgi:hypothetical protein
VRLLSVAALVSAILVGTAVAAGPDPSALVLRSSDVPREYALDRDESGPYPNARVGTSARARTLIARLGRVTGYRKRWVLREHGSIRRVITSSADVLRGVAGARLYVKLGSTDLARSGIKGLRRSPVRIGDEAWLFHGDSDDELAWVVWRSGRVGAMLLGWGIRPSETLALARVQQRRIEAATR